jgi:GTP-binding protein
LSKKRVLAISKADLLDEELMSEMSKELNKKLKGKNKLPYIFISANTGYNLNALKDLLWKTLNE